MVTKMSQHSLNTTLELRRVPSWVTEKGYETEFERNLLIAVHQQDIDEFRALLNGSDEDLSKYNPAINTCMEICCNRLGYGEFIEALLEYKFNPNAIIVHPGITAIHLAAFNANSSALDALLKDSRINVNMISGHGKVALHYIAEKILVNPEVEDAVSRCVYILLSHPGIAVGKCSITDWTLNGNALHLAARFDNYVVMKALLDDGRIDVNDEDAYGWTALHYAARHYKSLGTSNDPSKNCCLLLLSEPNLNVNKQTHKLTFKITALHLAAAVGNVTALEAIIRDKRSFVGALDSRQRNALHYAAEQSLPRSEMIKRDRLAIASLVHFADIDFNCPDFYEWIAIHSAASKGNFAYVIVMLQEDGGIELNSAELYKVLAQEREEDMEDRIKRCIALLIDHPDIEVNGYSYMGLTENVTPLMLAAKSGNYIVLEELMRSKRIDVDVVDPNKKTLLHYAVEQYGSERAKRCIGLLLQRTEKLGGTLEMSTRYKHDINAKDVNGDTALHLAAQRKAQHLVLTLLRHGASIALRGKEGLPIQHISPKVFEEFLNECIESNGKSPEDEHFQLTFSYKFLSRADTGIEDFFPESDPLHSMSLNRRTRHLLKHPVLRSFLDLKWRRVRVYFYFNVIIHVLFVVVLNMFIIDMVSFENNNPDTYMGNSTDPAKSIRAMPVQRVSINNSQKVLVTPLFQGHEIRLIIWTFLRLSLLGLIIKESFQLLVSPFRYITNIDNYVELLLIAGTISNLYSHLLLNSKVVPHVAATTILLSWTQLMFLTGRLPILSCQLEMLKKVTWTFVRFLAWYSFLLIAFALSFYTLFFDKTNTLTYRKEGGIANFFMDPYTSLLKTVLMMAGEYEASYIPFKLVPVTSHIVFVVFVFLIAIVMLNLLNGLAVSDTQNIRQEAEVLSLVSRVRLVYYIESMVLGDPQSTCWMGKSLFSYLRRTCGCFNRITKSILLFPHVLLENKIWILPNRDNRLVFIEPLNMANENIQVSYTYERSCCKYLTMDDDIVKSAMDIINSREVFEGDMFTRPESSYGKSVKYVDNYVKHLSKQIKTHTYENEKRLQRKVHKSMEELRNQSDFNVRELEYKIQNKLQRIEKSEQENRALLHSIMQYVHPNRSS